MQPGSPALRVLVCASAVMALALGVRHSLGLFLVPVTESALVGREGFSLGVALQNLAWGASGPIAGWLAERHGARPVVAVCALLLAAGVALMASAASAASFVFVAGLLTGVGLTGTTFTVLFGAIAKACGDAASRARALALATAVGSMGQVLVVPLAQALLAELGWRSALWCLAAVAALALPMALGLKVPTAGGPQATAAQVGVPLARAWRDRAYVLVALGFTACGVQLVFIATHLPAYLIGCGLSAGDGALSLALVGLFNVAGTYVLGRLAVRIAPTVLLAGVYGLRTLAIVAFISLPPTPLSAAVFASAMGLLWLGVGPVMTHLLATLYGLRHLSALFGGMYFTHQVGSFLGAWAGGALFESTGGYTVAWWLCVAVGAAAVVLTLAAGRGPTHGAPSITPQAA